MSRIVITTFGSLGDLYPYIAIGLGLQARGHEVDLATAPCYEQRIKSLGLGFRLLRPDCDWLSDPKKVRRFSHPRLGLIRVGRELLMPVIRESYDDTLKAADGADLIVGMSATYATRLVAEKTNTPWVTAVHIPLAFFSTYDPPILDVAPFLSKKLRCLGPKFWAPLFWMGKRASRFLAKPWYQLRTEIGLPPTCEDNPLVDSHSPLLVLGLFSKILAEKQPDWPSQTRITGFPFFEGELGIPPSLETFLSNGPPPIVFTLGSAVSMNAGTFFEYSVAVAKMMKHRAVFVTGSGYRDRLPALPAEMIAVDFAPFSQLFPMAAAIVHHGGVGTTGLAMQSGRPMLIVPFAWDQPDHAERMTRLGIARTIPRPQYTPKRAATELRQLLDVPAYSERSAKIAEQMNQECGVTAACDALEAVLQTTYSM